MTIFNITIVSDTICPWCFIGYRRLRNAIAQYHSNHPDTSDSFTITWHPFELNPSAVRGKTIDKRVSYESKYGAEQTQLIFERLRSAAQGTEIAFSFGGKTGSTRDSHRLLEFAARKQKANGGREGDLNGLQTRLAEELFSDYFERERDISSIDVLIAAAGRVGLDEREVRMFLESGEMLREVGQQADMIRQEGITGVPYFSINDSFSVSGAQEPAAFLMLFERLKKREGQSRKGAVL